MNNLSIQKKLAIAAALAALGFAGNYLALPVAFSVAFIFGSIFSIIAIGILGARWGVAVAIIASSYTVILWNHPYAVIIFALEALWIGLAMRRGRSFIVLIDAAFWLCLGWVVVALFYGGVMGLNFQATAIIILKQAINGMFNALLASIILHYTPISRIAGTSIRVTYQKLVFHSVCAFLMFPMLSLLLYMNYHDTSEVKKRAANRVQTEGRMLAGELELWMKNQINAVAAASALCERVPKTTSSFVLDDLQALRTLFPAFNGLYLADADAVTVAAHPAVNAKGISNIGISFADREYYKKLLATGKPVISDAILGKHSVFEPLFVIAYPEINDGALHHFAFGAISAKNLLELIQHHATQKDLIITLLDGKRKVIASTDKNRKPLEPLPADKAGQLLTVTPEVSLWIPGTKKNTGVMQAWKDAYYLSTRNMAGTDWKILVEYPVAPIQKQLYASAINGLAALALLFVPMIGIAFTISRYMTRPLLALAAISADIPAKVEKFETIAWPQSDIAEVDTLVNNFRQTSEALAAKIGSLNNRLALAADSARIGVWEWDIIENHLIWDKWMYALYGVTDDGFDGVYEMWQNGLHPDDKKRGDDEIYMALRGEKEFDTEFRVIWPTGEVRHIKAAALVLRDESGKPLRMIGVNYDITKRKLAEQEQKENKEMLSLILNSTAEAIYGIDMEGHCTFCNQACLDILGYENQDELLGKNMHDQIHHTLPDGAHFPVHECKIFKAFQLGQGAHVDDEFLWRKDGSSFPAEYWSYPQHKNDEIIGAVITFFNITERKLVLEELRHAKDTAENANIAKSQFLANMSHEIRTPMNAVMGMLHLLQRTELTPRQLDYAQKIQLASETLLSILNDILDFSKIEAGKLELEKTPFSLGELLRNLSVILSSAVQDKDIEILFSISPDIPHALRGDGLRLQQVLLNLASNAIKFTEQGEVVISVSTLLITQERTMLEFAVSDTGIGIAPEMLKLIFSGFVQAEASTTRRFGGTGLGLSISRQLVGLMGGKLIVESEQGKGSTFYFSISLERDSDSQEENKRKLVTEVSGSLDHRVTALIVDDNAIAREVLSSMVSSFGWQAETVSSGSEAIALVESRTNGRFPFDVVFMDWKMPGMNGIEAAGQIKTLRHGDKAPVVIMVTAHGREFLTGHFSEESSPLDGFLVKPVTPSMLFDAVNNVTSGRYTQTNKANRTVKKSRRLTGLRLLLVEDNLINQQVAEELITLEGATVSVAVSGHQAIDIILSEAPFDGVLMDIQMPGMDGYETTQHIRDVLGLKELPIIAMTANAMPADRERCLAAGMNDHVAKPFDVDKLMEVLRRNCGITEEAETENNGTGTGGQGESLPTLQNIVFEGFDCDAALKRLGNNRTLYARMARGFEKDQGEVMARLRQNQTDAAQELHTIKGVAATLGATALSRAAALEEDAVKNNEKSQKIKELQQDVERLFIEACSILKNLADELDPLPAEPEAIAAMDTETLIARLIELETLLSNRNMKATQQYENIRSGLESMADAKYFKTLDEAMQRLNFSEAIKLCRNIREDQS